MLQDIVIKEISNHLKCQPSAISPEMKLDSLGVDSLGAITILYELEDQFDIEIPNEVLDSLETVDDIVIKLQQLLDNKNSA